MLIRMQCCIVSILVCASGLSEESILEPLLKHTAADPAGVQDVLDRVSEVAPREPELSLVGGRPLDADACVEMALAHSPKAHMADADIAAREAQVGQAKSRKRPTLSATAIGAYISDAGNSVAQTPLSRVLVNTDALGIDNTVGIAQLSFQQVLYAGGSVRRAVEASEYLVKSETWRKRATLAEVALETRQAYYDALLSQALVQVARESVNTHQRHLEDAEHALEVGALSKFEVLRARTSLAASESDLAAALSLAEISMLNLKRLVGVPTEETLLLTGSLNWVPLEDGVEDLVAEAYEKRPEIKALEQGILAAENQVAAKRGQYRPTAGITAGAQKLEGAGELIPEGVVVGLVGRWDIYAGGRRKHEVIEAEAQVQKLNYQLAEVKELIALDVRQAWTRLHEAIAKIRKEKVTVASGQEGLSLSELRFKEGVGIQAETLDAELALTQARTALVQALRDYAVAAATLDNATGRSIPGVE
jgi:outer membrane protein TolC